MHLKFRHVAKLDFCHDESRNGWMSLIFHGFNKLQTFAPTHGGTVARSGRIVSDMGERKLKITSYRQSIPATGVCEKCGFTVAVRNNLLMTPDAARVKFNVDSVAHKCKPDNSNQAPQIGGRKRRSNVHQRSRQTLRKGSPNKGPTLCQRER